MSPRHRAGAPHRWARHILLFVGVPLVSLSVTFLLLYVYVPVRYQAPPAALAAQPVLAQPPSGTSLPVVAAPTSLVIKNIAVDAKVKPVGLTVDGDMAIDNNAQELAWYQLGPKPGEAGNAVIAGHYGWKDGVASVFNDINKLKPGDIITSYDADGGTRDFVVTQIRMYNPDDDATQVFISTDTKSHLNLVTCQGSWNSSQQTYSERLVVFTDEIKS